jgi:opacity protein-like surface antigen
VYGARRAGWIAADRVEVTAVPPGVQTVRVEAGQPVPMPQQPASMRPDPRRPRWMVAGLAGTTFGTQTGEFFAGGVGYDLTERMQLTFEVGRFNNLANSELQELADFHAGRAESLLSFASGVSYDVEPEVRMPAGYGSAGLRVLMPSGPRARPYVGGQVGLAAMDPEIRLHLNGSDVTSNFITTDDVPEGRTRMFLGGGGGVNVQVVDGVTIDVGYRYARIFYEGGVDVNRVYVGLGYVF